MKKLIWILLISTVISNISIAQVAINNNNSAPHSSAVLDVSSTDKGILVPRMTTSQRISLGATAANGLLVTDTQNSSFWFFESGSWHHIDTGGTLGDADGDTKIEFSGGGSLSSIDFFLAGTNYFKVAKYGALEILNSGKSIFIGEDAGKSDNLSNNVNIFIGKEAGKLNTSGHQNIGVGLQALKSNTLASNNIAFGYRALTNCISGNNIALGNLALKENTIGFNNIAVGKESLTNNTTGDNNIAIGQSSLFTNIGGHSNVAIGYNSSYFNTAGNQNVAIGMNTLGMNTTGSRIVAIGREALKNNTVDDNIAIGTYALFSNTTGEYNTVVGHSALGNNTIGHDNTGVGYKALYSNVSGHKNSALGYSVLYNNYGGRTNTACGYETAYSNTSGNRNSVIGFQTFYNNTSGSRNVAVGYKALYYNQTGDYNTAIGSNAGSVNTETALENTTAIGNEASVTASNQIRVGNTSVSEIGGAVAWSVLSDKRFKSDIHDNVIGLDFILMLKPVTYQLDVEYINNFLGKPSTSESYANGLDREDELQSGFIAQDVEVAAVKCNFDFSGTDKPKNDHDNYSLRYALFVVPLVKAIQEQQYIINERAKVIEMLKAELELVQNTN